MTDNPKRSEAAERLQSFAVAWPTATNHSDMVAIFIHEVGKAECRLSDIRSILAENDRMREALGPFALSADLADKSAKQLHDYGFGEQSDGASPGWGVTYGALKNARAALAQSDGEKKEGE